MWSSNNAIFDAHLHMHCHQEHNLMAAQKQDFTKLITKKGILYSEV